jgi:hypothetical protein
MKSVTAPRWLLPTAIGFQIVSFFIFWFVTLLADPEALKSSIYTYYQVSYYDHLSAGKLPWIQFKVEYPPLTVFCLLFPAYLPGMSVLVVSLLRATVSTILTCVVLAKLVQAKHIDDKVKVGNIALTSLLACVTPGYYHGLFDWTMYLAHFLMALSLVSVNGQTLTSRATWWLVWLGASIKLLPLLAAPFLAIGLKKDQRKFALLPLGLITLVHIPFLIWGFEGFRYFVVYHRMRGIDNFSIYSTALLTLERLGSTAVDTRFIFGALEVQGSISSTLAKVSLPLFLLILGGLWLYARRLPTINQRLGLYFVAILLYPAISKVSQNNYVIWSVSAICALWLLGFHSKRFFTLSAVASVFLILIGWFQNARFEDYLQPQTSWAMLFMSWLRFALLFGVSYLAIREINKSHQSDLPATAKTGTIC